MSGIYRVNYRLADNVEGQSQRSSSVRVNSHTKEAAGANAMGLINVMRGRQFKAGEVIIESVELDEATPKKSKP